MDFFLGSTVKDEVYLREEAYGHELLREYMTRRSAVSVMIQTFARNLSTVSKKDFSSVNADGGHFDEIR
jgi:hypothetical protein